MNSAFQRSLVAIAEERSRTHPADAERALQRGMDRYRRRIRLARGALVAAVVLLAGLLFVAHHLVAGPKLTAITVASSASTLQPNAQAQLSAEGTYGDGSHRPLTESVTWTSDNPAVAGVDSTTGKVTGVSPGKATITASADGITGRLQVTVSGAKLEKLNIKGPDRLQQGRAQTFDAEGEYSDGTQGTPEAIRWESSKPTVAKVDSTTGKVTGVSPGKATITASADGKEGGKDVVVTPAATETPTRSTGTGSPSVTCPPRDLVPEAYQGRPVEEVAAELTAKYNVHPKIEHRASEHAEGTVLQVIPECPRFQLTIVSSSGPATPPSVDPPMTDTPLPTPSPAAP